MSTREKVRFGKVMLTGVKHGTSDKLVLLEDDQGDILLATGTVIPADISDGYAKGCLFIDTNVGTGVTGLYCNKGTKDSCVFTAVTQG
ncbi:MAG: hypothetical protein IMZ43_09785 [Thermoplasmata archaeon]|nr:hypothetical protein [Thermoplasmata archaeon]